MLIAVGCQPEFWFYLWSAHDPSVYPICHYVTVSLSFLMHRNVVSVPSSKAYR